MREQRASVSCRNFEAKKEMRHAAHSEYPTVMGAGGEGVGGEGELEARISPKKRFGSAAHAYEITSD